MPFHRHGPYRQIKVVAEWEISANNRRARFYTLTTAGKKELGVEESRFSEIVGAIMRVMKTT